MFLPHNMHREPFSRSCYHWAQNDRSTCFWQISLRPLSTSLQKQRPQKIKYKEKEARSKVYFLQAHFLVSIKFCLASFGPWGCGPCHISAAYLSSPAELVIHPENQIQSNPSAGPPRGQHRGGALSPCGPLSPSHQSGLVGFIGLSQRHAISVTAEWQL